MLADRAKRKTTVVKVMDLVAFVLAQVRVAYVQFHLAMKLRRLPRLRHVSSRHRVGHFRIEFARAPFAGAPPTHSDSLTIHDLRAGEGRSRAVR